MMDKYDLSIQYLTERPGQILDNWKSPFDTNGGCLFQFVSTDGHCNSKYGCITMIRGKHYQYRNTPIKELTEQIVSDTRIPVCPENISVDHLPVFAEWQRRIDKILGRDNEPIADNTRTDNDRRRVQEETGVPEVITA